MPSFCLLCDFYKILFIIFCCFVIDVCYCRFFIVALYRRFSFDCRYAQNLKLFMAIVKKFSDFNNLDFFTQRTANRAIKGRSNPLDLI